MDSIFQRKLKQRTGLRGLTFKPILFLHVQRDNLQSSTDYLYKAALYFSFAFVKLAH